MTVKPTGYLARVCVLLHTPLVDDEKNTIRGYYVVLGVSTHAPDPRAMLRAAITDGSIDWNDTTWQRREPAEAGEDIQPFVTPGQDVWYRSGRMFFV